MVVELNLPFLLDTVIKDIRHKQSQPMYLRL